jgi:hypothetical protein
VKIDWIFIILVTVPGLILALAAVTIWTTHEQPCRFLAWLMVGYFVRDVAVTIRAFLKS